MENGVEKPPSKDFDVELDCVGKMWEFLFLDGKGRSVVYFGFRLASSVEHREFIDKMVLHFFVVQTQDNNR